MSTSMNRRCVCLHQCTGGVCVYINEQEVCVSTSMYRRCVCLHQCTGGVCVYINVQEVCVSTSMYRRCVCLHQCTGGVCVYIFGPSFTQLYPLSIFKSTIRAFTNCFA